MLLLFTSDDDGLSPVDVVNFIKEALLMKDFNHINVLPLLGIVYTLSDVDSLPLVVTPFMENGDLKSLVSDEQNVSPAVISNMPTFSKMAYQTCRNTQNKLMSDLPAQSKLAFVEHANMLKLAQVKAANFLQTILPDLPTRSKLA